MINAIDFVILKNWINYSLVLHVQIRSSLFQIAVNTVYITYLSAYLSY